MITSESKKNLILSHIKICNQIIETLNEFPNKVLEEDFLTMYDNASIKLFNHKVFCSSVGCLYKVKVKKNLNVLDCSDCLFEILNATPLECMDGLLKQTFQAKNFNSFIKLVEQIRDKKIKEIKYD